MKLYTWNFTLVSIFIFAQCFHKCVLADEELKFAEKYLPYNETIEQLSNFVRQRSDLGKLYSIGKSVEQRDLWVLKLSIDKSVRTPLKPLIKLVGGIHGNEALSSQLLLMLSEYLMTNFEKDTRVTRLLNQTEIHILPMANPDGREIAKEGDCDGSGGDQKKTGRENARGVDLDTDFCSPFATNEQAWNNKQPETLALMRWIVGNPFVLSASLHTGSQVVSYPYDAARSSLKKPKANETPDTKVFQSLALAYSRNHPRLSREEQCDTLHFQDGITNGAAWYNMSGGMADFNYAFSNCFETSLELSCCKYPNASELNSEWNDNWRSLLEYMEQVHMGVSGVIRNKNTGHGVQLASIAIGGIDHKVNSSIRGEYWRLLVPGTYNMTVTASGYKTMTKQNIVVRKGAATTVDFNLEPLYGSPRHDDGSNSDNDEDQFTFLNEPDWLHHDYVELTEIVKNISINYPEITRLKSIGRTIEGRDMWVLEITDNPGYHEPGEPEMKIVANIHGNEVVGRELSLILAKLLCESYGRNDRLTRLVDSTRIFILPSINPDGYERSSVGDYDSLVGRFNARGTDLNRNFPDQFRGNNTEAGFNKFEPETRAMMSWITSNPFVLSASLHGGALVANYPFDGNRGQVDRKYSGTPDDDLFRNLTRTYSFLHPKMHKGEPCSRGFKDKFTEGITNGAQWYILYGGMQDYNYLHSNCFEITIEMGCFKYPPADQLKRYWDEHKRSLIKFIEQTHIGIKGIVKDDENNPLSDIMIHVSGINHDVKTGEDGDYWRLLLPGQYKVSAIVDGMHVQTRSIIVPDDTSKQPVKVHFIINEDNIDWAKESDFSISENLAEQYKSISELKNELELIRSSAPGIVKVKQAFDATSTEVLDFLHIGNDAKEGAKPHFLFITGVKENLPTGREVLLRFARHLVKGYKKGVKAYVDLIDKIVLHIVPFVDMNTSNEYGDCFTAPSDESIDNAFLARNISDVRFVALQKIFSTFSYAAALNIETGPGMVVFPTLGNDSDSQGAQAILERLSAPLKQVSCNQDNSSLTSSAVVDFAYQQYGTLMARVSVDCCSYPEGSSLYTIYRKVQPHLLSFLTDAASMSVVGYVLDEHGKGVPNVQLMINPGNRPNVPVFADGSFNFLASAGSLYLTATAPKLDLGATIVTKVDGSPLKIPPLTLWSDSNVEVVKGYDDITNLLKRLAHQYSNRTRLQSLGASHGRDMWMLEISSTSPDAIVPTVLVTAGHHGTDKSTIQAALNFAWVLTTRYGREALISKVIDTTRVVIIPVIDVDGVPKSFKQSDCGKSLKYTTYQNQFDMSKGKAEVSKTAPWGQAAINTWISESNDNVVSSISLKSGATGVVYSSQGAVESQATKYMAEMFRRQWTVDRIQSKCSLSSKLDVNSGAERESVQRSPSKYADIIVAEDVNLRGTFEQALQSQGILSVAVYSSCCSNPTDNQIQALSQRLKLPLITFIQMVHEGIQGQVVDSRKRPLANSLVFIQNKALKKTTGADGKFHLPLPPGKYAVEVCQVGYFNMTKLVTILAIDPSTEVEFRVDVSSFFGSISSSLIVFSIVVVVLLGMSTLVFAYLLCNGTLFGRNERLRRKGFMPVSTQDDALEFKPMRRKPDKSSFMSSSAPDGYTDLRALELSTTDDDSDEEIYQPQFKKA